MQAPFIKIRCHRLELSGTPKRQTQGPGCIAELPVGPGSLPRGASEAPFHLRHVCWGTVGLGCSGGLFLVHQDHTHTHTHTPTHWRLPPQEQDPVEDSVNYHLRPTSRSFCTEQQTIYMPKRTGGRTGGKGTCHVEPPCHREMS